MPRRKEVESLDSLCFKVFPSIVENVCLRVEDIVEKGRARGLFQRDIDYQINLFIEEIQQALFTNTPRCFHNNFVRKTRFFKSLFLLFFYSVPNRIHWELSIFLCLNFQPWDFQNLVTFVRFKLTEILKILLRYDISLSLISFTIFILFLKAGILNWLFATNSDFLISISLQPNDVDL